MGQNSMVSMLGLGRFTFFTRPQSVSRNVSIHLSIHQISTLSKQLKCNSSIPSKRCVSGSQVTHVTIIFLSKIQILPKNRNVNNKCHTKGPSGIRFAKNNNKSMLESPAQDVLFKHLPLRN